MSKEVPCRRLVTALLLTMAFGAADGGEPPRPGGTVTFKGRFAADGSVAELRIIRSEPTGKFDEAATRSLRTWKVKPWWAKSAARGREFNKTINFFDDSALTPGAVLTQPEGASIDGLVSDVSWSRQFRIEQYGAPRWPNAAMSPLTGGWIRYSGTITTEGRVADLKIVDSFPAGMFDDATLRAARNTRFVRIDGQPITEPHPFVYIWEFDAGFTTFEMMQASYITRLRGDAQRLLQDLAELCPVRYPRADDEINRALVEAPRRRPLPTDPAPVLPDDVAEAIELTLHYGECAFSSWEQLKDKRAYHAAARLGWFDQSIFWRGRYVLCERAIELGLDASDCRIAAELKDDDREIARRWIATQYGEGYQQLIARRAAERGTVVQLAPATREAIAAAKAARGEDQRTKPIAILSRALKRAEGVDDRAMLQLALARVLIDLGSGGDAQEQIDAVIGTAGSPWYAVQMARVLSFAVPPAWRDQRNDLEATLTALNRELGTTDRLIF